MRYKELFQSTIRDTRRLYAFTAGCRGALWAGVLGIASLRAIQTLLWATTLGNGIAAIMDQSAEALKSAALVALAIAALYALIEALSNYFLAATTARATASLRSQVMQKLLGLPLGESIGEHGGTKLSYLLNDSPVAIGGALDALIQPCASLFMLVTGLWFLGQISMLLVGLSFALAILFTVISLPFSVWMRQASDGIQEASAQSASRMKDILASMVEGRMYPLGAWLARSFEQVADRSRRLGIHRGWLSGKLGGANNFMGHFCRIAVLYCAGLLFFQQRIELPTAVRVSEVVAGVVMAFGFARTFAAVQESLAGAQRVFGVLDEPSEDLGREALFVSIPEDRSLDIRFDRVSFRYERSLPILRNLSFRIKRGESVAILGESGCGKSTVLSLIMGLYHPQSGQIEIMGVPLKEYPLAQLRGLIAWVPQNIVLLPTSVKGNIALGNPSATADEIVAAAKQANAHGFIMELPQGYDTILAERGSSLSGGQRQRIGIARALVKQAPILLLDEATAALDPAAEGIVAETLASLSGKMTIAVVTHRPSTAQIADQVLRL